MENLLGLEPSINKEKNNKKLKSIVIEFDEIDLDDEDIETIMVNMISDDEDRYLINETACLLQILILVNEHILYLKYDNCKTKEEVLDLLEKMNSELDLYFNPLFEANRQLLLKSIDEDDNLRLLPDLHKEVKKQIEWCKKL